MPINIISTNSSYLAEEFAYKSFDILTIYTPIITIPFLFIIIKNTKEKKFKYTYIGIVLTSFTMMYLSQTIALEMLGIAAMKLISLYEKEPIDKLTTYSFLSILIIFWFPFCLSAFLLGLSAINDIGSFLIMPFSFF